ncbi:MAG: type II toxin-antitoxin system RelE/ParE family toxin [Alphaproteobacteria bacterium]
MPQVRLSRRAQEDFDEIVGYLFEVAGAGVSARYAQEIRAAINGLATLPHIGPPRHELGAHVRMRIVAPYLIFYDPVSLDGIVEVLRILHGARDIREDLVQRGRQ